MKRTFLFASLVMLALMVTPATSKANLISNPGFDDGTWSSWNSWATGDSGATITDTQSLSPSYSLKEWAWSGGVPAEGSVGLYQDFSAIVDTTYYASTYIKSLSGTEPLRDGTYAYLTLEWHDESGVIGTPDQLTLNAANDSWQLFQIASQAPTGTTFGRIILGLWSPALSGDGRAAYFDNAYVDTTPVPEPASLILLSSGIMGLIPFCYRKRINKEVKQ